MSRFVSLTCPFPQIHILTRIALRELLVSLMGSTTPCPNHFVHSYSRRALREHEATCPTVTHALVPQLYAALDPDFLTIQVRRGVFGAGIFELLGEAMKVHCAPVRDGMVDDMVRTALRSRSGGDVALALRKCFDCVEVMKLVSATPASGPASGPASRVVVADLMFSRTLRITKSTL